MTRLTFTADERPAGPLIEAAPARAGVRMLALALFAVLLLLAGRAVQLAFAGDPLAGQRRAASIDVTARGDLVDRNGVLLATTVRAFALTASPGRIEDPEAAYAALHALFPDLEREVTLRRLTDETRQLVFLRRGLSREQRTSAEGLALAGIGFETEDRREYPQGELAAHALGFTDRDLNALAGVERGLDADIRRAGALGRPVRLSLDVRVQYVVESELAAAAQASGASGGAAILLDGKTGETLAMASWPTFNPNVAGQAGAEARRDRVSGDVHELGSTMKPFTAAMALDLGLTTPGERFNLTAPYAVDGAPIHDHEPAPSSAGVREMLAHSSNIGAAMLAVRVGAQRQRDYLGRLGLLEAAPLEAGRAQAPLAPAARGRRDVAGIGFGYGLAATPAALAGAYTVFANGGARVAPTLRAHEAGAQVQTRPVFASDVTAIVLSDLRAAVVQGTGRAADVPGLEVAGKTGTAEKLGGPDGGYDSSRNFSSFAGLFPASDPRYVIVLALDEPLAGPGRNAVGGATAAPAVGRILTRAAPLLGLRLAARPASPQPVGE